MGLITVGSGVPENQLDPGTYEATLAGLSVKNINDGKGGTKDVYEWVWHVASAQPDGTPGEPFELNGLTSLMTGPKSKTFSYLIALLGEEAVQPSLSFDLGDLVGKSALVKVEHNDSGYAKVTDAFPMPKSMKPTVKAAATAEVPAPAAPGATSVATAVPAVAAGESRDTDLDDLPF